MSEGDTVRALGTQTQAGHGDGVRYATLHHEPRHQPTGRPHPSFNQTPGGAAASAGAGPQELWSRNVHGDRLAPHEQGAPDGTAGRPPLASDLSPAVSRGVPVADGPAAAAAPPHPLAGAQGAVGQQKVATHGAREVTIGERLQLADEFNRRKQSGEAISMAQFAKEKGKDPHRFKEWHYAVKKQREAGTQVLDPIKRRNRPPQYPQIEDEIRQLMAGHDDPTSVPPMAIREKAMQASYGWASVAFRRATRGSKRSRNDTSRVLLWPLSSLQWTSSPP
ncbi:unnamed protein product [Vitrella brassicaformis CCMP3155]|uniref:HTH CENPB-type domain-containing protein n=1 Tax=Vitrella brassicaformis (strain CCMP3155) TaxID=1169540 RepID=A0A0G4H142_VITBC|nr:unnamed protein product [Vitrella brassicaformis CCMP3155]|mmetsp:Transcript_42423/g.120372  ORF Transcript_42423/g.120372 Transcript_42423/m.120372 type:complete len:278 (-) Transcript_42423:10-843(-)|eukprot:CEM37130.1 unnamed protein product [Vitrella brassicaformis CCMP3155]